MSGQLEFLLKFGNVSKIMTNGEKIISKALFVIVLLKTYDFYCDVICE